jgi:3'-phosphoadenosine 5'-phosphosulfate (PAPS) 3'-phosphatase
MMNNYPLLSRMVAAAVNVSQKSARILREVKKSGELNIKEKKDETDLVTRADFLSQLNIIKSLEHLFPQAKFCGEEGDLKEEYDDLETSLNETVLNEAKLLPDVYNQLKEEDVYFNYKFTIY